MCCSPTTSRPSTACRMVRPRGQGRAPSISVAWAAAERTVRQAKRESARRRDAAVQSARAGRLEARARSEARERREEAAPRARTERVAGREWMLAATAVLRRPLPPAEVVRPFVAAGAQRGCAPSTAMPSRSARVAICNALRSSPVCSVALASRAVRTRRSRARQLTPAASSARASKRARLRARIAAQDLAS